MAWRDRLLLARMQAATISTRLAVSRIARSSTRHAPPPRDGPMRVLLLASQPAIHAATRHRLSIWADRLRRAGHHVLLSLPVESDEGERLFQWPDGAARLEFHRRVLESRRRAVEVAHEFDVAVVHLTDVPYWEYGSPFVAAALARTAGRVLLDLDDLPVVRGEQTPHPRAVRLVDAVDGLVLGNRELRAWFPDRPAWIVPTCIDTDAWPSPAPRESGAAPILGWIGTAGGLGPLEALAPVLAAVCARHGARVRVICDVPARLPGVPAEFVGWRGGHEPEDLAEIDVGLAPLADGPVERCKCGLKALEYSASSAPVVASPVGALAEIVVHGETGLHASSPDAWAAALDALLTDRSLRSRMGAAGRAAVERRWSVDAHAAGFESALRGGPTGAA